MAIDLGLVGLTAMLAAFFGAAVWLYRHAQTRSLRVWNAFGIGMNGSTSAYVTFLALGRGTPPLVLAVVLVVAVIVGYSAAAASFDLICSRGGRGRIGE